MVRISGAQVFNLKYCSRSQSLSLILAAMVINNVFSSRRQVLETTVLTIVILTQHLVQMGSLCGPLANPTTNVDDG